MDELASHIARRAAHLRDHPPVALNQAKSMYGSLDAAVARQQHRRDLETYARRLWVWQWMIDTLRRIAPEEFCIPSTVLSHGETAGTVAQRPLEERRGPRGEP